MQACSPGYEQLVLSFSNPVSMDHKDNHEEMQAGTSEINMRTAFHVKKAETEVNESEEIVVLLAEQMVNKLSEHNLMEDRSSTKRQQTSI